MKKSYFSGNTGLSRNFRFNYDPNHYQNRPFSIRVIEIFSDALIVVSAIYSAITGAVSSVLIALVPERLPVWELVFSAFVVMAILLSVLASRKSVADSRWYLVFRAPIYFTSGLVLLPSFLMLTSGGHPTPQSPYVMAFCLLSIVAVSVDFVMALWRLSSDTEFEYFRRYTLPELRSFIANGRLESAGFSFIPAIRDISDEDLYRARNDRVTVMNWERGTPVFIKK